MMFLMSLLIIKTTLDDYTNGKGSEDDLRNVTYIACVCMVAVFNCSILNDLPFLQI